MEIPDDLMNLILLFYVVTETFDRKLCGQNIIISSSDNKANDNVASKDITEEWQSVMGSMRIDTLPNDCMIE